jgi:hypothetical protein
MMRILGGLLLMACSLFVHRLRNEVFPRTVILDTRTRSVTTSLFVRRTKKVLATGYRTSTIQ